MILTAGYGFVDTFRYGDYPTAYRFPEHRLFEQVLLKHKVGKLDLQHRYRLEQRFLGVRSDPAINRIDSSRYENRFRHLTRVNIPLTADRKYYIGTFDEFFINFGENVASNIFDQNRAYVALGLPIAKGTKIEIGYMLQIIQQRNGRVFEYNHTSGESLLKPSLLQCRQVRLGVHGLLHHRLLRRNSWDGSSKAQSAPLLCGSNLAKRYVQDGIFLPVLVVEVPPFKWIDREALLFHGLPQ